MTYTNDSEKKVILQGRLAEFVEALQDEKAAIDKNGQSSILLLSGQRVEHNGQDFWYRFYIDYMPSIPADTPCNLVVEKNRYNVTVVRVDESEIIISSKELLPPTIASARLENGSTVLLERMIKRIEDNSAKENPVGERMLDREIPFKTISQAEIDVPEGKLNSAQEKAVLSAVTNDITFIWGPPGTGKTTVIGTIIKNLYKNNRSVLVVSHTNVAVDGAIEKVVDCGKAEGLDPVLRIGLTQKKLPENVSLEYHVKKLGKELYERQEVLKGVREKHLVNIQEFESIIAKLNLVESYDEHRLANEIETLERLFSEIDELESAFADLQKQSERYKMIHPELMDYERLLDKKEQIKKALETNASSQKELSDKIELYKNGISQAKDELLKHKQFVELSEKIDEIMSEEFLKGNIMGSDNEIARLSSAIKDAEERINDLTNYIDKTSKNTLAALLSRKKIEESEKERNEAITQKSELENRLVVSQKTRNEYSSALIERRSLCERRDKVTPSYTEEHWENIENTCKENLSLVEESMASFLKTHEDLEQELSMAQRGKLSLHRKLCW